VGAPSALPLFFTPALLLSCLNGGVLVVRVDRGDLDQVVEILQSVDCLKLVERG